MARTINQLSADLSKGLNNYFPATLQKKDYFEEIASELENLTVTQEDGLEKTLTATMMLHAREAASCVELANPETLKIERLNQILQDINGYLSLQDTEDAPDKLYTQYNTTFNSGTIEQVRQPLQKVMKSIITHLEYRVGKVKRYFD